MCGRNNDARGDVNDRGFLTIGEPQIHDALREIEAADIRIAVLHPPSSCLADFHADRIEDRPKRVCHFILHGREHKPTFDPGHSLTGQCAIIPAGACFDGVSPLIPATPTPATSSTSTVRHDP
jgi:hypothetical protein